MKIGFDAKRAFHNSSGLGNYSRDLIQACIEFSDWEIHLFNPKKGGRFQPSSEAKIHSPESRLAKKLHPLWRSKKLGKLSGQLGLDVYHGLSNELPNKWTAKRPKRVVTIHDVIFEDFPEQYRYLDRKIYRSKTQSALDLADSIVMVSKETLKRTNHHFRVNPDKVHIIPPPIHPSYFEPVNEETQNRVREDFELPTDYLLTVGSPEHRKNQRLLAEASKRLGIPLVMVGKENAYGKAIEREFPQTQYLTQVKLGDLPAMYMMAQAFVYGSTYEGFGMPLAEAMAMGCPVIAPDLPLYHEVTEGYAHFYHPQDLDDLCQVVSSVPSDSDPNLRSKGAQAAAQYTRKSIFDKLASVYHELAE